MRKQITFEIETETINEKIKLFLIRNFQAFKISNIEIKDIMEEYNR